MHLIKKYTFLVTVIFTLASSHSFAQVGSNPNIFIKDFSNVRLVNDTVAVSCSGQEVWIYFKGCATNDVVNWSNGMSGDSIKISSQSVIQASCQSNDVTISPLYYLYFDNQPEVPSITKQNLNPSYSCLGNSSFYLYASCQGFSPSALWQDNSVNLQYSNNQNGTYSARCVNQCGTTDSSTVYQVFDAPFYPKPRVNVPAESICGIDPLILSINYPLTANDSLKYIFDIVWSNGSTETSTNVTQAGSYFYSLTKIACGDVLYSDTVNIVNGVIPPIIQATNINPSAINGDSVNICQVENFTITASGCDGGTINWSNGQSGNSIIVSQTGTYSATCTKICGVSQNSNLIKVYNSNDCYIAPPTFTSNKYYVCEQSPTVTMVGHCVNSTLVWVNPTVSSGDSVSVSAAGTYSAVCEVRGVQSQPNSINIGTNSAPTAPIITVNKTILCFQEYAVLTATGCLGTITWSGGITGTTMQTKVGGEYYATCNNDCGTSLPSDTITLKSIEQGPAPTIEMQTLPNCKADSALLISKNCGVGNRTLWSNGVLKDSIIVGQGTYFAYCQNLCGNSPPSNSITVNAGANVAPPQISANNLMICGTEKATLVAIGCEGGTTSWSNGVSGDTILVSNGVYSAKCILLCGVSSFSNPITITLEYSPVAPTISTNKLSVCFAEKAILTASGCPGGTISWNGSLGLGTGPTVEVFSGTYTAVCTTSCGSSGNSNSITLGQGLSPNKPQISSNKNSLCQFEKATLTATSCIDGTIAWSNGMYGTTIQVGTGSYAARCENSCGSSILSDTINIVLNNTPNPPAIFSTFPSVCGSQTVTISASGCVYGTVSWSNGQTGGSINVGQGTYSATCINQCGTSGLSNSVTISNIDKPNPPVLTSDVLTICDNQIATITATGCEGGQIGWNEGPPGNNFSTQGHVGNHIMARCFTSCGFSDSSNVIIISVGIQLPPIISKKVDSLCVFQKTTISAINCANGIVNWSTGETGTSISVGPGTYFATCTGDCGVSGSSYKLTIFTKPNPVAPIIASNFLSVCGTQKAILLVTGCKNGIIRWSNAQIGRSISIGAGTYTATCTELCGVSEASNPLTITNGNTTNPPTIVATKTSVCSQEITSITASGCDGGQVIWSTGDTLSSINKGAGIYYAKCLTACGSSVNSDTITISEKPIPASPIIIASKTQVCGSLATLTASGCIDGTIMWSTSFVGTTTNVGAGTYTAICSNSCGVSQASNSIVITNSQLPSIPNISTDKLTICGTEKATLSSSGCNIGTLKWSTGETTNTILVGFGTYMAQCDNACESTATSVKITISSGTPPSAPVISTTKTFLCGTETATLTASGCNNGTISWSAGGTGATKTVGAGTYSATCTTACGTSSVSNSVTISTGGFPPAPVITANKTSICSTEKAILIASGCNGGTITWTGGGIGTTKEVGAGEYVAKCTNACGISSNSNTVSIAFVPNPSTITLTTTKIVLCPKDSALVTAQGCNGTLVWNNAMIINPIKITVGGYYSATCSNGCGVSSHSDTIQITQGYSPIVPIITVDKLIIFQGDTTKATVSNCNGTVQWSNGKIGQSIGFNQQGTYWAKCSNICGISEADTVIITLAPDILKPKVAASKVVVAPKQMATLSFSNCTGNVLWSNGMTTNTITVGPGTYSMSCNTLAGAYFSDPIVIQEACSNVCVEIGVKKLF